MVFALMLMSDKLIKYINKQYFYFYISSDKINIFHHLFVRNHTSSKLNLEVEKLSRAVDNQSNIYRNLSETDFPYINKFIRRTIQAQSDCKLSNSSNLEQLELISPNDMGKLNRDLSKVIPSNPKLLTLDSMDNELNNIIHNQMKNFNKENVELH